MVDELLTYYEKELAYIRQMGAEFTKEHPKIAGRLGINSDTIEDPHVSRLIESIAYLNARIQHKLNDDFPELSDALLSVLFPHYQRPIPSMSIVQFIPDQEQLEARYTIPQNTLLDTESFQGEICRFATAYPVDLQPIHINEAKLIGRPFTTPGSIKIKDAGAVLKLSLSTFNDEISFADLELDRLRFYLRGQPQHINPLYRLLLKECQRIVIALSETDTAPQYLGKEHIQAVGFAADEGLLPYPAASFMGYRLLTEYFVFPEKFMFIDFAELVDHIPENVGSHLDIYCYLSSTDVELEHNISADTFVLGCAPTVNLFQHRTDPIKLDHTQIEYPVVADMRRPLGYEVYSIDSVIGTTSDGDKTEYHPLYGLTHDDQDTAKKAFWFAVRRHAKLDILNRDEGTDVFLSLVDLEFNPNLPEDQTLTIEAMCSNRDIPAKVPYDLERPKLQCVNAAPPCEKIRFLIQPTVAVRPPLGNHARWRIISHLSLNHLSLTGRGDATQALKEILRLYDFTESSVTRGLIDSIQSVTSRPITAPLTIDDRATLCRGIEVEITLDDDLLTGSSNYLFASVLERFFGLYCSINSFTRVLIKLKNKEGYLKQCPPRAGEQVLL